MAEGQILQNPVSIGAVNLLRFAQASPPFGALALQQMAPTRSTMHDFAGAGYFETLAYSLSGLNAFGTTHIGSFLWSAKQFPRLVCQIIQGLFSRNFETRYLSRQVMRALSRS